MSTSASGTRLADFARSTETLFLLAPFFLVAVLVAYHLWCGKLLIDFKHDRNTKGHVWFRWFNEFPVLILFAVVILVVVKPF